MHLVGAKEMFDFELNCLSFFFFLRMNKIAFASVWVRKGVEIYTQEAPKTSKFLKFYFNFYHATHCQYLLKIS